MGVGEWEVHKDSLHYSVTSDHDEPNADGWNDPVDASLYSPSWTSLSKFNKGHLVLNNIQDIRGKGFEKVEQCNLAKRNRPAGTKNVATSPGIR